ncbi:MAG: hypothetical protein PVH62_00945 [Anaerolineae bacterium]|jgi:hypothetical protein
MIRSSILLLTALLLLALGPSPSPAWAASPDYRFGVVEAHIAPWAASDLGAGWTRVTFIWSEIQPDGPEEEWNLPITDEQLALELSQGRQVVGLVVNTPAWATDPGRGAGVPQGLYLGHNDPNNLWADFLSALVARYAGRIDHWIIWNEPDIWDTYHQSWGGSVEDFAQLMRVSYGAVKETNPNATVHLAAVTHWWDANYGRELFFRRLLQIITADPNAAPHNYYFDVATLHIYFQPENVYDLTVFYRNLMREYGLDKPIWIAETNAAPSEDPAWPVPDAQFKVTLEDQAAYIIQATALGIAGGAERMAVYKMSDTERDLTANPEPFGLVRADGTRRPAFTAYQVAINYLAGFRSATWERREEVSVVVVNRGEQTTTVVWSRTPSPQTVIIPAQTTRGLLVDMWGGARTVHPERGYYTLNLPGCAYERQCLIGGAPLMLVEDAPGDTSAPLPAPSPTSPAVEVPSLPTATPAPTHTPTPTITPTSMPTSTPTPSPTPAPTLPPTPSTTPSPANLALRHLAAPSGSALPLVGVLLISMSLVSLAFSRSARDRKGSS